MVTSFPLFQLLRSQSKSTSFNIKYTYGPSAKLSIVSRMLPLSVNHYWHLVRELKKTPWRLEILVKTTVAALLETKIQWSLCWKKYISRNEKGIIHNSANNRERWSLKCDWVTLGRWQDYILALPAKFCTQSDLHFVLTVVRGTNRVHLWLQLFAQHTVNHKIPVCELIRHFRSLPGYCSFLFWKCTHHLPCFN